MTVTSPTIKVQYDGDGSTVAFPTQFKFYVNSHVQVIHTDDAETNTTWVEDTHYTLDGAGSDDGGTVTVKTTPTDYTPASGERLTIIRDPALLQETVLPIGGPLSPPTVERMIDLAVMGLQRQAERIGRALVFPETEDTPPSGEIPGPAARAGKLMAFAADGSIVTVTNFGRWRGDWQAATAYVLGDAARSAGTGNVHVAIADFTSGSVESTDLANAARWSLAIEVPSASFFAETFSGDTIEDTFALLGAPASAAATSVYVDGTRLTPVIDYTVTDSTLTFDDPPGSGTDNILVVWSTAGTGLSLDLGTAAEKDFGSGAGELPEADNVLLRGVFAGFIPASAFLPHPDAPCGGLTVDDSSTAGETAYQYLPFADAVATRAVAQVSMPKMWNRGTLTFRIAWTRAAAGTGNVMWAVGATARSVGEDLVAAIAASHAYSAQAVPTAHNLTRSATSSAVDPADSAAEPMMMIEVMRNGASGSDTFADDVRFLGLEVFATLSGANDA